MTDAETDAFGSCNCHGHAMKVCKLLVIAAGLIISALDPVQKSGTPASRPNWCSRRATALSSISVLTP